MDKGKEGNEKDFVFSAVVIQEKNKNKKTSSIQLFDAR